MPSLALSGPRHAARRRPGHPHASRPRVLDAARLATHLDRLYRAALGLCGNPQDAEDLVQDVCVKMLAKPRLLSGDDELGYLLMVLRNTFISNCRTAARRPTTVTAPEDLDRFETTSRDPHAALEASQLYADIAALPEHQRDALVAVDLVGLSYKEASKRLAVPTGTIMSRLFRARQALAAA